MNKNILKVLPKIIQWESIPYSAGLRCACGKADLAYATFLKDQYIKPLVVGWCETDYGFMGVFECPECHSKFRCHCGSNQYFDIDSFSESLNIWLSVCANQEEIENELQSFKKEGETDEK